jgi:hypothetical protein
MSSITVGRKFSAQTCCRAVCCRLGKDDDNNELSNKNSGDGSSFQLHHPAVMGTAVYMDETGVIDMSSPGGQEGQEVRFYSSQSWVSWFNGKKTSEYIVECIDGSTGFAISFDETESGPAKDVAKSRSLISTAELVKSFLEVKSLGEDPSWDFGDYNMGSTKTIPVHPSSLEELRRLKMFVASPYEDAKNLLLKKHPVLRDWKRRDEHFVCKI